MRNHTLALLRSGKPAIGSWMTLASPLASELLAHSGYDFLVVDTEHSPTDTETVVQMLQAMKGQPVSPIVRVVWNDVGLIKRALDSGAHGVIVPMVNTVAEAEQAVAACRYPPVGVRSVGGTRPPLSFGVSRAEYLAEANQEIMLAVQIEHVDAVGRVEEIAAVAGVDSVFVGPNDLCASMGLPPLLEPDVPAFEAALAKVVRAANANGKAAGILVGTLATGLKRLQQGFSFVAIGTDAGMVTAGAQAVVLGVRRALG
ncbi:MAG TPA: aldolase/citrate lyase family protein [Chloroflexota bacterium]|nr:aldolase/citrate lyase family protein [Chloroflexota bacterium]